MASPFPNDGSFLERFKQLQQDGPSKADTSGPVVLKNVKSSKASSNSKGGGGSAFGGPRKGSLPNGKLAFSLKQKSRLAVNAIKLGEDEDEEEDGDAQRQAKKVKTESASKGKSPEPKESVPAPPADGEVKKVADKLALFVAKNGRQFEEVTREKNLGKGPFSFLYDTECAEYKYYEYRVAQEEAVLAGEAGGSQASQTGSSGANQGSSHRQSSGGQQQRYQTPASALYSGGSEQHKAGYSPGPSQESVQGLADRYSQQGYANDSVAMMEFYMKKAAQEAIRRPPKQSKDEMPPPPGLHPPGSDSWKHEEAGVAGKKGHHMGDYIPPEELEKFLAKCNDAKAAKAAKATADRAKIQADNVGHRLLSKMGDRKSVV